MAEVNVAQSNWVSGELSGNMRGRFDLPIYASGAERMVNFIAETTGAARFRSGTQFVNPTRRNQVACLLPFIWGSTPEVAPQRTLTGYRLTCASLRLRVRKVQPSQSASFDRQV